MITDLCLIPEMRQSLHQAPTHHLDPALKRDLASHPNIELPTSPVGDVNVKAKNAQIPHPEGLICFR